VTGRRIRAQRSAALHGRASTRERGAVLIEFALVVMLLVTLGMGIFEYGAAWRSGIAAVSATRGAARTVSSMGNDPQADYLALSSLKADLSSSGLLTQVQRVVIYKATAANGQVPVGCLSCGSVGTNSCNIFTGAQLSALSWSTFNTTTGCSSASVSSNWCPNSRVTLIATGDYVGIWVQTRHTFFTKLFGQYQTISRFAVMKEEPSVS
jgi:Flp pilus assembly protein TadG